MYYTEGIILKREDFRERDERIFLYTKDFGRITPVAKGLKRIEAKLRGNLDVFNFVDIIFVEGINFPILVAVDTRERFRNFSGDISSYTAALSATNIVLDIFEERARDGFFEVLYRTLKRMDECNSLYGSGSGLYSWMYLKKFQLAVLREQGYTIENPHPLIVMLQESFRRTQSARGEENKRGSFTAEDFIEVEEAIFRAFAYNFNYNISKWLPVKNH